MDDRDGWYDRWTSGVWVDVAVFYVTVIGLAMLTAWAVVRRRNRGPR